MFGALLGLWLSFMVNLVFSLWASMAAPDYLRKKYSED